MSTHSDTTNLNEWLSLGANLVTVLGASALLAGAYKWLTSWRDAEPTRLAPRKLDEWIQYARTEADEALAITVANPDLWRFEHPKIASRTELFAARLAQTDSRCVDADRPRMRKPFTMRVKRRD